MNMVKQNQFIEKGNQMERVKQIIRYHPVDASGRMLTGKGVAAAILDTGIAGHPDLSGRIRLFKDFVHGKQTMYDDNGHGTHVAGILAGNGACGGASGIAPEAEIVALKVLDETGNGKIRQVIAGIRFLLSIQKVYKIRIVNISVGTLPHPKDFEEKRLLYWVEKMWDQGLIVVVAAGNLGPGKGSITVPGNSRKVITVGAFHETKDRPYSGRGPAGECVVKPDLLAPGTGVMSCGHQFAKGQFYQKKSGTSMATPVVSGAAALLVQGSPGMSGQEVKRRLWDCCDDLGMPLNVQGRGLLNIEKLCQEKTLDKEWKVGYSNIGDSQWMKY